MTRLMTPNAEDLRAEDELLAEVDQTRAAGPFCTFLWCHFAGFPYIEKRGTVQNDSTTLV